MFVLSGILIIVVGFAIGLNPLLVVAVAAFATGLADGMNPITVVARLGHSFIDARYMAITWLVLPVIGLLERSGLRERARTLIASIAAATAGRVIMLYFVIRQITSALGLLTLGGHAQMVRPLIAPMAEAAAIARNGPLPERVSVLVRAYSAATDNIGAFFGEDIFVAVGSILLIKAFLQSSAGLNLEPLQLAIWAVPTAIAAFFIHGTRLMLFDRRIKREIARASEERRS
jgi:uncharacterized membrane protein